MQQAVHKYLAALEAGDADKAAALFVPQGWVQSPFLGKLPVRAYVAKVASASGGSRLTVHDVLVNLPFGRSSLFREAADRALPPWAADIDVTSWAQYFLKYVIGHPAVTSAIPGSTQLKHLEDNQAAGRGRLPDAAMRRRMEEYWDART